MAGNWRISLGALLLFTMVDSGASAFPGRLGMWPSSTTSSTSTYAAPLYYYNCPPSGSGPLVLPVPDARAPYASPTPAPPSSGSEPPMGSGDSRMPKITTTRSLGAAVDSSRQTCRVGFWNLAGRDVMLTIDGKSWSLPKNQVLTFNIDRQFTWQVAGQMQHVERVPEGNASFEVLVRE